MLGITLNVSEHSVYPCQSPNRHPSRPLQLIADAAAARASAKVAMSRYKLEFAKATQARLETVYSILEHARIQLDFR